MAAVSPAFLLLLFSLLLMGHPFPLGESASASSPAGSREGDAYEACHGSVLQPVAPGC